MQINQGGRWLAYRIRKDREKSLIHSLTGEEGTEKYAQEDFKRIVGKFYQKLYQIRDIILDKQREYLKSHNLIKLNEEQKKNFNKPISIREIVEAIKNQNKGKSPGPDGLPIEYYSTFEDCLLLPYKQVLENVLAEGKLPETWKEATISLIHKDNTVPTDLFHY